MRKHLGGGWTIGSSGGHGNRLQRRVRKYGQYAAVLAAPASSAAVSDPTGATAAAAAGLNAVGLSKKLLGKGPTLEDLKKSISTDLRQLQLKSPTLRFLTIIDDTDRLEPIEAVEVLRLIRKVADFPLITYLVCFDRDVLVQQVEHACGVHNGDHFIEKIFQNVITVPPQEPFALRSYLRRLFKSKFADTLTLYSDDRDASYREHLVLDVWVGKFLRTPRDVVRLYEAVKLGWPHVPARTDFWDFVWLQLVKLKCTDLYEWTQNYLMEIASYRDGGRPGDDEPAKQGKKLASIMKEFGWNEKGFHSGLGTILPGVGAFVLEGDKQRVFEFANRELARFEAGCRLGSPTHWRQYFAFSLPSYALADDQVAQFRNATAEGDISRAAEMVRTLMNRPHQRKSHFLDVLLDRVWDAKERGGLAEREAIGLARVFAETMDEVAVYSGDFERSGRSEIGDKTLRLLTKDVAGEAMELVLSGKSVNWLAEVTRDQGFACGLPEGARSDPDRQWLTQEQLEAVVEVLTKRFQNMAPQQIYEMPSPLDILFCWLQLGDKEEVRAYVAASINSDKGVVSFAEAMRGWSNSSNVGVQHPIPMQYVEFFTDAAQIKLRIQEIANGTADKDLSSRAKAVLADWSEDKFYS